MHMFIIKIIFPPSCDVSQLYVPIRLLFYLSFNKCILRKVIFSTDMSYKRHIFGFGSHWGTEMHVLNISKNAFHSIPRRRFLNLWFEANYTENALHSDVGPLGWLVWGQDENLGSGRVSYNWWLKSGPQVLLRVIPELCSVQRILESQNLGLTMKEMS